DALDIGRAWCRTRLVSDAPSVVTIRLGPARGCFPAASGLARPPAFRPFAVRAARARLDRDGRLRRGAGRCDRARVARVGIAQRCEVSGWRTRILGLAGLGSPARKAAALRPRRGPDRAAGWNCPRSAYRDALAV